MKILVVGKFSTEQFALHIEETLLNMGHIVFRYEHGLNEGNSGSLLSTRLKQIRRVFYDALSTLSQFQRIRANNIVAFAVNKCPDIIIVSHDFLMPEEIKIIKKETGTTIVLWFPDSIGMFGRAYFLNGGYDALFFKDPYIVCYLKNKTSLPVYYLPECFNPRSLGEVEIKEIDKKKYECDLTTAGNIYPYREAFFQQIIGYKIKIWVNPPPTWMDINKISEFLQYRFVADNEKVKAFRTAKIVINSLNPAEIWGLNARAFEIAGARGFQLIDWRPGLNQLFNDGKEVVSFSSIADLKRKIDHYLVHDCEREAIAHAGMQRAIRDHTYEIRLDLLLSTIAGREQGYPLPRDIVNNCV
jgi:spore maturation protein CgeB